MNEDELSEAWEFSQNVPAGDAAYSARRKLEAIGKEVRESDAVDVRGNTIPGYVRIEMRKRIGTIMESKEIREAWSCPSEYAFSKYEELRLLDRTNRVQMPIIHPRLLDEDIKCRRELSNLFPFIDSHTAVILDLGGSHGIAIAPMLMTEKGMQPIIKLPRADFNQVGIQTMQQLGAMMYFANEIKKTSTVIPTNATPVFILDCHRSDSDRVRDRNFCLGVDDFPNANELKRIGITKVIYVNEADMQGKTTAEMTETICPIDLLESINDWKAEGIQVLATGISPRIS